MKRLFIALTTFLLWGAAPALADSMFTFNLTGDGNTFQFTVPNPSTVVDHPHAVQVGFTDAFGSVNGTGGYSFTGSVVAAVPLPGVPELELIVSPDPPGIHPPYTPRGDSYFLLGPIFTTLVSDVANPYPDCSTGVCNDLLTFAYLPGQYALSGFDPDNNQVSYTLTITPAAATAPTPEPPGIVLMLVA